MHTVMPESRRPALASLLPLAVVGLLFLSGCLAGSRSSIVSEGRYVSGETLSRVRPGESEDFVLGLLGAPSDRVASAKGTEIWTWRYESKTTRRGSVLLLASSSKSTSRKSATFVEFEDGIVIRTWRDDTCSETSAR